VRREEREVWTNGSDLVQVSFVLLLTRCSESLGHDFVSPEIDSSGAARETKERWKEEGRKGQLRR